jgi:arginine utilization protein RocB
MKGGAAIQMALFEEYARAANMGALRGNIVIIGLPDEENLSAGGRAAALILKELKDRHGLDYRMAINSEPTDRTLGENRPKLYVSSIGKILPVIYASGALAHTGNVFEGLNPIKIMASIVRRLDLNPAFIDSAEGAVSSPATFLYLKDGKRAYDVSLPMSSMGCMTVMFLSKSVRELVEIISKNCSDAFEEAISDARESFAAYLDASGDAREELPWKSRVVLYSELYAEAAADSGDKFTDALRNVISDIKEKTASGEIDQIEAARILIETTLLYVSDRSPRVVVALAPPYYPVVANSMLDDHGLADSVRDSLITEAREKFGDEPVRHCLVEIGRAHV